MAFKTEMMLYGSRLRAVEDVVAEALDPENAGQRDHYLAFLLAHAFDTEDVALRRVCDRIKMVHGDKPFGGLPTSAHNIPPAKSEVVSEYAVNHTTDERVKRAMEIVLAEKVAKYAYDHAFIMLLMNQTEELPSFSSAQSYLDYMTTQGFINLPSKDTIEKKISATFGKHPQWTFTDKKGQDATEMRRRNGVGTRFYSAFRKGI